MGIVTGDIQPQQQEAKARALLRRFYGYSDFRPMQLDIIQSVCSGRDTVVLMPTGGGKSICYQLPALMADRGVTVVVSPLIALMHDQVAALLSNGIPAASVNSCQSEADNRTVMDRVFSGHIKLLYISPERLLAELPRLNGSLEVAMIAVDEAHCISQWGHDFRPEYTQLGCLKEHFPDVPVMALTATADKATRDDIVRQLKLRDPAVFVSSFDRPNISLTVVSGYKKAAKMRRIKMLIDKYPGDAGIVYCMSRNVTEQMAAELSRMGYRAAPYHARMSADQRMTTQQLFINGDLQIVCATVAFGMGIDKSNIRWVVHNNMPLSLESYYQEIGRAGRDGLPAEALMFFSASDLITLRHFVDESGRQKINGEKLRRMRDYVDSQVCRRRVLLSYFSEVTDCDCGNCDVCLNPPQRFDGTRLAQMALSAVVRTDGRAGFSMLIDVLRGSARNDLLAKGYQNLKTYGVGRNLPYREWNHYLTQMLQLGLIDIDYSEMGRLSVTELGRRVLFDGEKVMLAHFTENEPVSTVKPQREIVFDTGNPNPALVAALKNLRTRIARMAGMPPYVVFSDKTLLEMARKRPTTRAQFFAVEGVGERKCEKYFRPFVNLIRSHLGLSQLPEAELERQKIVEMLHERVAVGSIADALATSEAGVYREISRMIDADKFSEFDLVIKQEEFVGLMDLNRKFSEAEFRQKAHALYPEGMEDVAIAIASWLLRRRAEGK